MKKLIKLANELDRKGLFSYADKIDEAVSDFINKTASTAEDKFFKNIVNVFKNEEYGLAGYNYDVRFVKEGNINSVVYIFRGESEYKYKNNTFNTLALKVPINEDYKETSNENTNDVTAIADLSQILKLERASTTTYGTPKFVDLNEVEEKKVITPYKRDDGCSAVLAVAKGYLKDNDSVSLQREPQTGRTEIENIIEAEEDKVIGQVWYWEGKAAAMLRADVAEVGTDGVGATWQNVINKDIGSAALNAGSSISSAIGNAASKYAGFPYLESYAIATKNGHMFFRVNDCLREEYIILGNDKVISTSQKITAHINGLTSKEEDNSQLFATMRSKDLIQVVKEYTEASKKAEEGYNSDSLDLKISHKKSEKHIKLEKIGRDWILKMPTSKKVTFVVGNPINDKVYELEYIGKDQDSPILDKGKLTVQTAQAPSTTLYKYRINEINSQYSRSADISVLIIEDDGTESNDELSSKEVGTYEVSAVRGKGNSDYKYLTSTNHGSNVQFMINMPPVYFKIKDSNDNETCIDVTKSIVDYHAMHNTRLGTHNQPDSKDVNGKNLYQFVREKAAPVGDNDANTAVMINNFGLDKVNESSTVRCSLASKAAIWTSEFKLSSNVTDIDALSKELLDIAFGPDMISLFEGYDFAKDVYEKAEAKIEQALAAGEPSQ